MKKLIMLLAFALCAFGCSAEPITTEEAETLGEQQEALGTCTKPSSPLIGDNTSPFSSYVYAIHANATTPWKLDVEEKNIYTGIVTVKQVDFGGVSVVNSQAAITGPGWTGSSGQQIYELDFLTGNATLHTNFPGCPNDSNYTCVFAFETTGGGAILILIMDRRYSSSQGPFTFGEGLTAIQALGDGTQKIAFTGDYGASGAYTQKVRFFGTKLDACAYP